VTVEANFRRSTLSTGREFNENGPSRGPKGTAILFSTDSIRYHKYASALSACEITGQHPASRPSHRALPGGQSRQSHGGHRVTSVGWIE